MLLVLVMPVIMKLDFEDGTSEVRRIPAEIWRRNNELVSKVVITEKPLKQVQLDPQQETADSGSKNNYFPRRIEKESIGLSTRSGRRRGGGQKNPMQKARDAQEKKKDDDTGT